MEGRVLGIQQLNYVSKKTGNPVVGVTLHCAFKDPEVTGECIERVFVSDNLNLRHVLDSIWPGDTIDVTYNRRGYVAGVSLIAHKDDQKADQKK